MYEPLPGCVGKRRTSHKPGCRKCILFILLRVVITYVHVYRIYENYNNTHRLRKSYLTYSTYILV